MQNRITTYNHLPIQFTHGNGIYLYATTNGQQYIDTSSGVAVSALGHAHPEIIKEINEQSSLLIHCSNMVNNEWQQNLAEHLCSLSGLEQVFFTNCGASANETAIKCTRLYGKKIGNLNPKIIVMNNAFHGRTLTTLSASWDPKIREGFEPLVPGFICVPYNDIEAIKFVAKNNKDILAILVEPIQGQGGIIVPDNDYLIKLRQLCDQNNWLLILDEIQTGIGRTGKMFCYQHNEILPDLVTIAKGIANGFPCGACLMGKKATNLFKIGSHGSTFGGNPFICRIANKVLSIIDETNLLDHVKEMGSYFLNKLQSLKHKNIADIRGKGLLIGVEFNKPCKQLLEIGLNYHLYLNITQEKVLRLMPPLIIQKHEIDLLVSNLELTLANWDN